MSIINNLFKEVDESYNDCLMLSAGNSELVANILTLRGRIEDVKRHIEAKFQPKELLPTIDYSEVEKWAEAELEKARDTINEMRKEDFVAEVILGGNHAFIPEEGVVISMKDYIEILKERCKNMINADKSNMSLVDVISPFQDLYNAEAFGVQYNIGVDPVSGKDYSELFKTIKKDGNGKR